MKHSIIEDVRIPKGECCLRARYQETILTLFSGLEILEMLSVGTSDGTHKNHGNLFDFNPGNKSVEQRFILCRRVTRATHQKRSIN